MLTQNLLAGETILFLTHKYVSAKLPNTPKQTKNTQHGTLPSSTAHLWYRPSVIKEWPDKGKIHLYSVFTVYF